MVNLLIQDVANSDEANTMFPYLRNFDPYSGHSWASGAGAFFSGNNHESSSEALNFASAVTFWGAQTGDVALQNLGNYLYSTEVAAVQQYWFDINNMNFPDGFDHTTLGMVWGDGGVYGTWFSGEPEMIHGINYLPMTAASLYLGLYPEYAAQNYAEMVQVNGGAPNQWTDIMLEYQALFNPAAAVSAFTMNYQPEEGESLSHTYSWINNLNALGQVDRNITANTAFFSVFNKDGLITYVAYNPTNAAQEITFSDGTHFTLQSEETIAMNANRTWSSVTGLLEQEDPVPQPDPVPTPDPVPVPDPVVPPSSAIYGTANSDSITGTMGNDVIYGLAGNDQLHGLDGNDTLYGGDGNDHLYGLNGNDILIGGSGSDFLVGGAGDDIYRYLALSDSTVAARDFIETFEQGHDKIDLSALNVGFNQLVFTEANGYKYIGISGTDFSIQIGGSVNFQASDFILNGSSDSTPNPVPDPVPVPTPTPTPVPSDSAIIGTNNAEVLTGTMNNDVIYGLSGNDQLHGLAGNDTLYGGDGNDQLFGGEGNDILIGGAGADFLSGGDGQDVFQYLSLSDSTLSSQDFIQNFEQGSDKIDLSALHVSFNQLVFTQQNGYNFVGINGTDFSIKVGDGYKTFTENDFILNGGVTPQPGPTPAPTPTPTPVPTPVPDSSGIVVTGTVGNDVIYGSAGDDELHGLPGNDVLYGGDGNDRLYGNAGDDILIGGAGADFLVGGDGSDVYKFENLTDSTSNQRDTIEGFRSGEDQLDLTLLNINVNDVTIQAHNGIQTLTIAHTNFAVDFIASDPITHSDIAV